MMAEFYQFGMFGRTRYCSVCGRNTVQRQIGTPVTTERVFWCPKCEAQHKECDLPLPMVKEM